MEHQLKQSSSLNLVSLLPKIKKKLTKKKQDHQRGKRELHLPITETQNAVKAVENIGALIQLITNESNRLIKKKIIKKRAKHY